MTFAHERGAMHRLGKMGYEPTAEAAVERPRNTTNERFGRVRRGLGRVAGLINSLRSRGATEELSRESIVEQAVAPAAIAPAAQSEYEELKMSGQAPRVANGCLAAYNLYQAEPMPATGGALENVDRFIGIVGLTTVAVKLADGLDVPMRAKVHQAHGQLLTSEYSKTINVFTAPSSADYSSEDAERLQSLTDISMTALERFDGSNEEAQVNKANYQLYEHSLSRALTWAKDAEGQPLPERDGNVPAQPAADLGYLLTVSRMGQELFTEIPEKLATGQYTLENRIVNHVRRRGILDATESQLPEVERIIKKVNNFETVEALRWSLLTKVKAEWGFNRYSQAAQLSDKAFRIINTHYESFFAKDNEAYNS